VTPVTEPRSQRHPPRFIFDAISLGADPALVQPDGTLWSHAATLGCRVKDTAFCIDRACVENFIRVFTSGSPQKVPVDYDHGSTTDDPEIRRARAMGKVPKAGDVLEMRGMFGAADFTGALKTTAEKLAKDAGRTIDDARNLGLWIRWRPTAKALQAIQAREYTELSIAWDDDWPNNTTGEGQGPAILAVALLNLPFLDDMLPVAASRHGGSPAAPGNGEDRMTTKLTLLSATAALLGIAVTDEEQAATELTKLQPEIGRLRTFGIDVGAEIGETDPAKAVAKVKELKASNLKFEAEAKAAKKAQVDASIEATLKKYEKRLTVPLKAMFVTQLRAELEKGTKLEDTDTIKALESMTELGIVGQIAGGDLGGANADDDVKIDAKARELMESNPILKAMVAKGEDHKAYVQALSMAERALGLGRKAAATA
jgi:hypothetical protein